MNIASSAMKVIAVLLLFGVGFFFTEIKDALISYSAQTVQIEETCKLSSLPCTKNGIDIELEKDVLTPLEPSSITVNWPNLNTDNLIVSLKGHEMEMGNPIFKLSKNENHQFNGTILLPICTQNSMTWVGTISDGTTSVSVSLKAVQ
ncbi:hypothetical protein [Aliivibrio logei]|uniref:Uncharacterized protein n=1 Tax=Aliivibrio logei TaxID=688 RepID=A0A1B9P3H4_ALILO|nr:hypothetical protein [Aliivibrio logei]OCH23065.1 hypothetical protein A6E04_03955 [Aliivibrio logei]